MKEILGFQIRGSLQKLCLLYPSISMETKPEGTITLFNRAYSQLQNIISRHNHHHWPCIFTSDKPEPACRAYKTSAPLELTRRSTVAMMALPATTSPC